MQLSPLDYGCVLGTLPEMPEAHATRISERIQLKEGKMSEQHPSQASINKFEIALRMRDFEIAQLTTRNNFFMIFQGVLLAGVVQSSHSKPVVSLMICIAGFFVALFQVGMASGAKFWQEYWEEMLSRYEREAQLSSAELFHDNISEYERVVRSRMANRGLTGCVAWLVMRRFSVSRIPIHVGLVLAMVWALLVLCALRSYPPLSVPSFVVGF